MRSNNIIHLLLYSNCLNETSCNLLVFWVAAFFFNILPKFTFSFLIDSSWITFCSWIHCGDYGRLYNFPQVTKCSCPKKKNTHLQYLFWEIKCYINSMVLVAACRNVINIFSCYPYMYVFYKMLSVWKPTSFPSGIPLPLSNLAWHQVLQWGKRLKTRLPLGSLHLPIFLSLFSRPQCAA